MEINEVLKFKTLAYDFFGLGGNISPLERVLFDTYRIFLKRDDKLSLGSSKERSIIPLIYSYIKKGTTKFVISSSGNAGLVTAFCALNSKEIEEVIILFSKNISQNKFNNFIKRLGLEITFDDIVRSGFKKNNLIVRLVDDPRQEAFNLSKAGYVNLRGSTDNFALLGFESIAYELDTQLGEVYPEAKFEDIDIYIPASSGTTAFGVYNGFQKLKKNPALHIVQTSKIYSLVKNIVSDLEAEPDHPAESIVDIIGHRRKQIENLIHASKGQGYIINTSEVESAKAELKNKFNLDLSYDSALTYSAFLKNKNKRKYSVFLITG
jgi:threonine synthase